MAKTEKEQPVLKIDDKEYDTESLNSEQKAMVNHIQDLDRKLQSSEFNLIQLRFGKQAFADALKASLEKKRFRKVIMIDSKVFSLYAEYGAIGIIVVLFVMMIMNLIKSQKLQNEDLDIIRQSIVKAETKMINVEGIILKMLDRWNRSDEVGQRHREDIVKELNDVTDDLAYLKGRINGK